MSHPINSITALAVIIGIASVAAAGVSTSLLLSDPASAMSGIGFETTVAPVKCILDPDTGTCPNCPICGDLSGVCGSLYEIQGRWLSGSPNQLHNGLAFCTSAPTPPNGGTFRPGSRCIGIYNGTGPHQLFNFGCYR